MTGLRQNTGLVYFTKDKAGLMTNYKQCMPDLDCSHPHTTYPNSPNVYLVCNVSASDFMLIETFSGFLQGKTRIIVYRKKRYESHVTALNETLVLRFYLRMADKVNIDITHLENTAYYTLINESKMFQYR